MCGRYAASRDAAALVEVLADLGVDVTEVTDDARAVVPSHNVAPTRLEPVLTATADGGVRLAGLSWGLVPSWSKDRKGAARMINARIESVADRSAYRSLLGRRRCLVPVDGWFEWQALSSGKQPHFVHGGDGRPVLLLAGLYTWWRDVTAAADPRTGEAPWFGSFTVLTGPARPDLAWLHDRMPVVVHDDRRRDWLARDGEADPRDLLGALRADLAEPDRIGLAWHPVDRRVGSVAHDEPGLVAPLPAAVVPSPPSPPE